MWETGYDRMLTFGNGDFTDDVFDLHAAVRRLCVDLAMDAFDGDGAVRGRDLDVGLGR